MKHLLVLPLLTAALFGSLDESAERVFKKEAQTQPLCLPPRKALKVFTLKPKYKMKGVPAIEPDAKSRRKQYLRLDCLETDVPRGLEFSENFSSNIALSRFVKLVGQFGFSEKIIGNRRDKEKNTPLPNTISNKFKYDFGFNFDVPASPVIVEGLLETTAKSSYVMNGWKPKLKGSEAREFEKVTLKFKVKY